MLAYLIRHAESRGNTGQDTILNSRLSDLGRRQAQALAERFSQQTIAAIYSSPYERCLETALPISRKLEIPIRIRADLCEYHHNHPDPRTDLGLLPLDEICKRFPEVAACQDAERPSEWPPIDEPFLDVLARMRKFAAFLQSRWTGADDCVVVVGHGMPVARLIEAWLIDEPGPSFRFVMDNAAVNAVRYHANISSLVCLNEISHLAQLPAPVLANYRNDRSIKPRPATEYY